MRIGVLDNYDSFTYNLVHYLEPLCEELVVYRNDEVEPEAFDPFDAIVLSPGPELPKDAGILMKVISRFAASKPILGICLGMQGLVQHFGGELFNLEHVMHGRQVSIGIEENSNPFFSGISNPTDVGLYHSWGIRSSNLPKELISCAEYNTVCMAIRHRSLPLAGLQFHPESIMTPEGKKMLSNWMDTINLDQGL